ncbi:hypothetical protein [Rhizobium tropici]|nr:hypothetical protein [Rhizobium tropici]
MADDPKDLDGSNFDPKEIERRLHGLNTRRETVDQPTTVGCWHDGKHYPEDSVILIDGASVRCMLGLWKPILTEKTPSEPGG